MIGEGFCGSSGLSPEAAWTSGTEKADGDCWCVTVVINGAELCRSKKQRSLLRSVCGHRFGSGWLTAEGATPQKFGLPHLFTC